ncbi:M20/M25/M40 family metallo-hydrolase [Paenibacillus silvae]|nr:M20/M25/M40 family metallo-hydrolase [Paenibacillus silvae]
MITTASDPIHERILDLGSRLIRLHPTYTRPDSQKQAQLLIQKQLEHEGWTTYLDVFTVSQLVSRDFIRHPWEYNRFYKDGFEMTKHNLYAVADSGHPGPTLILNGHIDVDILNGNQETELPWNVSGNIVEGRMLGRGATDMLLGLSTLVYALSLIRERFNKGKLIFTSVIDEEIGGNGSIRACEWLNKNGYFPDGREPMEVVIAEPTNTTICTSSLGFLPFKIQICSKNIHMNAQEQNQLADLNALFNSLYSFKEEHEGLYMNVGTISGGSDPSLPIQDLILEGVMASDSRYTIQTLQNNLRQALSPYTVHYPNLMIEPMKNDGLKFGRGAEQHEFPSACDASVFHHFGYPTVIFGPGRLAQAHTEDEYIEISEVEHYAQQLKAYLIEFFT